MRICGQEFNSEVIGRVQAVLKANPSISRRKLSRLICQWMDWCSPNGKLREMSCRKVLLELDRQELINLAPVTEKYAFEKPSSFATQEPLEFRDVECTLTELGQVEIIPVSSRYSKLSRFWNTMMDRFHYLGKGPLCGAQIRYLINSSKYGWLGGLSFSSATWSLKERDSWIGWSEAARRENLHRVVCNSRFLILPTVRVKNLASYLLGQCLRRLYYDWQKRYGYTPVLVETFVDPERYKGTSYRAANWTYAGKTSGRRAKVSSGLKDIYVYPLRQDWRDILSREKERPVGSKSAPINLSDWVEEEFGRVDFFDNRLRKRLYILARDFYNEPGELVPRASNGSEAKTKGAYRFFNNKGISMGIILRSHKESTIDRCEGKGVVLAVQDTTILNYSLHPATDGLGPINTKEDKSVGLILHDTMALTANGTPLGLLDVQCWARDFEQAGKSNLRKSLPTEEKESIKWFKSYIAVREIQELCNGTEFVVIGDRKSDIYELFHEVTKDTGGHYLLVRAERSRNRKVEGVEFWERMKEVAVSGYIVIHIPRRGSRPAREAKLKIGHAEVVLQPPKGKSLPPVRVWAVYVREVESEAKKPLEWMLLTTMEVKNFEEAREKIEWYTRRWGIEVYHKTLKSCCRIEDHQLRTARRLKACLAIDMVTAWRIYYLTTSGRETPNVPCTVSFEEAEWKALHWYVHKEEPPKEPPTLREMTRTVARIGGFLGRKCDGEPRIINLYRGLRRLEDITAMYNILSDKMDRGP